MWFSRRSPSATRSRKRQMKATERHLPPLSSDLPGGGVLLEGPIPAPQQGGTASWGRLLWLAALVLAACLGVWGQTANVMHERYAFVLAAAGLLALFATSPRFRSVKDAVQLALLTSVVPIAVAVTSVATAQEWLYPSMEVAAIEMSGLLAFLSVWELARSPSANAQPGKGVWVWWATAIVAVALLLVVLMRALLFERFALSIDQNLYLFQAATILHDARGLQIPADLQPLLGIRQSYFRAGFLNGQYPPGWPAVLALFRAIGLLGVTGPLFTALTVLGVVILGWRERSPLVGVVAGALTVLCFRVLYWGATYLSEPYTCFLAVYAALCLSVSENTTRYRRVGLEILAGLLLGLMLTTRPLTAVGVAAGLAIWRWQEQVSVGAERIRSAARVAGFVILGALPATIAQLWYNARTTGSAAHFGYDLAHRGLQALGFGVRGFIGYDRAGVMHPVTSPFHLGNAVYGLVSMIADTMATCQAVILILPLLFLARRLSVPRRWAVLIPFMVLPAAYFFYFYHDSRFYVVLVPFFMLLTAGLVEEVIRRDRRVAFALIGFAVWAAVASYGQLASERGPSASRLAYFHDVDSLRQLHGRLLVFAHDDDAGTPFDNAVTADELFTMLYWYNTQPFNGDVVVVRDVARLRRLAMACFPGRLPVVVSGGLSAGEDGAFRAASISTLERPTTAAGACGSGGRWSAAKLPTQRPVSAAAPYEPRTRSRRFAAPDLRPSPGSITEGRTRSRA